MKTKLVILVAVATLVLALAFPMGVPAAPNAPAAKAAPAASARPNAAMPQEHHPQIRQAIQALQRAEEHLEHANHDFGGHRVGALRATHEAIHQLEVCLKYNRN
jgi:hypothetical protein